MKCYYLQVPGMTGRELKEFVQANIPSEKQLLTRAKRTSLPTQDGGGKTLEEYIACYRQIPSKDLTIRFTVINYYPVCVQYSSGGGKSRKIKDGLRRIVQRHFARKLRKAGRAYLAYEI